MGFKFSLVIPSSFIIGLPTYNDEEPVTAKTINTLIISHLYFNFQRFSNTLKSFKVSANKPANKITDEIIVARIPNSENQTKANL